MSTLVLENPTTKDLVKKLYEAEGKAEIINGEIVEYISTGDEPGTAAANILVSLKLFQRKTNFGIAYGDNVGFLVDLPNRKSFSPDASFFTGARSGMKFLNGSPVFAVEVRSENDYGEKAEKAMKQKRFDYFQSGTEIVWDVDLLSEKTIKSYHRDDPDTPRFFKRSEMANAEPTLPGWEMAVEELFEE